LHINAVVIYCYYFLAFDIVDLTAYIPDQLRSLFMSNALQLSLLEKGVTYNFELNTWERDQVNSILSHMGSTISELIKIPDSLLEHVKFSKLVSHQILEIYHKRFPRILKRAFKRAHVESNLVWNFLIAIRTGRQKLQYFRRLH